MYSRGSIDPFCWKAKAPSKYMRRETVSKGCKRTCQSYQWVIPLRIYSKITILYLFILLLLIVYFFFNCNRKHLLHVMIHYFNTFWILWILKICFNNQISMACLKLTEKSRNVSLLAMVLYEMGNLYYTVL